MFKRHSPQKTTTILDFYQISSSLSNVQQKWNIIISKSIFCNVYLHYSSVSSKSIKLRSSKEGTLFGIGKKSVTPHFASIFCLQIASIYLERLCSYNQWNGDFQLELCFPKTEWVKGTKLTFYAAFTPLQCDVTLEFTQFVALDGRFILHVIWWRTNFIICTDTQHPCDVSMSKITIITMFQLCLMDNLRTQDRKVPRVQKEWVGQQLRVLQTSGV